MTAVAGLRGLALLDAVIGHIEEHPETHVQEFWRCATGMCLAGWTAEMAGGRWVADPEGADSWLASVLAADDEDDPGHVEEWAGLLMIEAADRAQRLLGIDSGGASRLFNAGNELEDIRRIRDQMAEAGEIR